MNAPAVTPIISFRALAAARVKVAIGCGACRSLGSFGVGAWVETAKADVDIVEAWNLGRIRCRIHATPADFMSFTWDNPMGSRDRQVACWRAADRATPFELPDPVKGPPF